MTAVKHDPASFRHPPGLMLGDLSADSQIDPTRRCGATVCGGDGSRLFQLVPARVERKLRLLTAAGWNRGDGFDAFVTQFQDDGRADTAAGSDASRSACDLD